VTIYAFYRLRNIRHLVDNLEDAHGQIMAEADPERREQLIRRNQPRWTALRDAFERASDGKCWYTECKSPGADNDIDHFRPKLGVKEDGTHPGYYWLAFDWYNMRLSCQRANRPRRSPGNSTAGGKADHFPLLPKGIRARGPDDDLAKEHPALLDPTEPGDPILLTFLPNGEIDVSPEYKGNAIVEAKIDASRLGLHLNWPRFRDARVILYNQIERQVKRGEREAPKDISGMSTATEAFKDAIRELCGVMKPSQEFAAAARVYVQSFSDRWWVREIVMRLQA
jgi:uncharacterized protein (TIGR02646 family)